MDAILTPELEHLNISLTRAVRRLEAATSRLEDIAATTNGVEPADKSASIARSTGGVTGPTTAASAIATPPAVGAAPAVKAVPAVEKPRSIADFDLMLSDDLQPFVTLSNKIGGLVAEQVCAIMAQHTKTRRD